MSYVPDADPATLEAMALMSLSESHLLVSPYEGQDSPFVLTAWGCQLAVESMDTPAATSFLDLYLGRCGSVGETGQEPVVQPTVGPNG